MFVLDKIILDRYSPSTYSYPFAVGVCELFIGGIVFGLVSSQGMDSRALLGGFLASGALAIGFLILVFAIRFGQVARVVPLWSLSALVVAPMAALFLDEKISATAAFAIILAVTGAGLVSWQRVGHGPVFGNPVVIMCALVSAFLNAISLVLTKYFLEDSDFWEFYASFRMWFAPWMLMVIVLPEVRREIRPMMRNRKFIGLTVLNIGAVVSASHAVRFAAVSLGPVSLVSALLSTQPGLVFLYSVGLATLAPTFFGDWITRGTIRLQIAGIAAITAAVAIITLQ